MELSTSTWMMIFFIISLVASIWKIYAFLPNKELKDDDTTESSIEELEKIILDTIKATKGKLEGKELCLKIKEHSLFDEKHFWRFNENKLRQIMQTYYLKNPPLSSVKEIYIQHKDI